MDSKSRIEQVAIEAHELCLLAASDGGVRGVVSGQLVLDRQLEQYTEQYAINCVEPGPYRFVNELELVAIEPSGDGELRVRRSGFTSLSIS